MLSLYQDNSHPTVRKPPVIVLIIGEKDLEGAYSALLEDAIGFAIKHNAHHVLALGGKSNCTKTTENRIRAYLAEDWRVRAARGEIHPDAECPEFHAFGGFRNWLEKYHFLTEWLNKLGKPPAHLYTGPRHMLHLLLMSIYGWFHFGQTYSHVSLLRKQSVE